MANDENEYNHHDNDEDDLAVIIIMKVYVAGQTMLNFKDYVHWVKYQEKHSPCKLQLYVRS